MAPSGAIVFFGGLLYACFIDESGCTGRLTEANRSRLQPIFAIGAVFLPVDQLSSLTMKWLALKCKYYPRRANATHHLSNILWEIKGADLRADVRCPSRNRRRHALRFLGDSFSLLTKHGARYVSRVYVKGVEAKFDGRAVYTSSIQDICRSFDAFLREQNDTGFVIADSRWQNVNTVVSHSVFTQKFRASGDVYPRLVELPTFGHSENHAGLQVADLLVSALIFPLASRCYCHGEFENIHAHERYDLLRTRFGGWLEQVQYRYADKRGRWRGGLTVIDGLKKSRSATVMFSAKLTDG